jgi:hypothetical protein
VVAGLFYVNRVLTVHWFLLYFCLTLVYFYGSFLGWITIRSLIFYML